MGAIPHQLAAFVVREIRRGRAAAEQTQEAFGRAAGFSASHVSAVESGARALTIDFIRGADRALSTGGVYERLVTELGTPTWFRPWLEAERAADQLRCFEPNLIPGLLQTEDYARAVVRPDTGLTDEEVERIVAGRLERQAILDRDDPPHLVAVIDQAALERFTDGFAPVMAAQLVHLLACAERPRVSVHVLPSSIGMHIGLSGPFVLARAPENVWVGHLENQLGGDVVTEADDLARLLARWEGVRNDALPARQSIELIKEVVRPWT